MLQTGRARAALRRARQPPRARGRDRRREAAGADGWILGGDYALFGGWPAETVARLRELERASWIRGNGERWTADPDAAPDNAVVPGAIAAAREALGADSWPTSPRSPSPARTTACWSATARRSATCARSRPARATTRTSCSTGPCADECCLRSHAPPVRAGPRRAASSSSIRASSACRSTATRAPPTRCSRDDGRIELRRVPYDHAASAERVRALRRRVGRCGREADRAGHHGCLSL